MIKIIIVAIWALVIANLFIAFPPAWVMPLKIIGGLLAIAHVIEFFVFRDKVKAQGDSPLRSFLMTFVFGVAYFGQR